MWIQTIYVKYVNYRNQKIRTKISDRLAVIEAELPKQKAAIMERRISRDSLKCATNTLEQHDDFTESAVAVLNEEIRNREHLAKNLQDEQSDLNVRLAKLPGEHPEMASSPTLAYS